MPASWRGSFSGTDIVAFASKLPRAPPHRGALHPAMGLGGRSLELSLAAHVLPDPGAFKPTVEQLHAHRT